MNLSDVFKDFCDELSKRKGFLSEDNTRFYWFSSMLKQDNDLNHYSLEEPYTSIPGKELDLMYEDDNEIWAIEIKFHRHTNNVAFPHPNSAGAIFDDVQRLPLWTSSVSKPVRRIFLYVTDQEMHNYLSCAAPSQNCVYRRELRKFYMSPRGKLGTLSFGGVGVSDTPKSFYENACESCSANVSSTGNLSFSGISVIEKRDALACHSSSLKTPKCWIRLYEILEKTLI
jgi:hypothetical protein